MGEEITLEELLKKTEELEKKLNIEFPETKKEIKERINEKR